VHLRLPDFFHRKSFFKFCLHYQRDADTYTIIDFSSLNNRVLKYSIIAAFFPNLGHLSVVLLITMYLKVSTACHLDASILLIQGLEIYFPHSWDNSLTSTADAFLLHRVEYSDYCHVDLSHAPRRYPTLCRACDNQGYRVLEHLCSCRLTTVQSWLMHQLPHGGISGVIRTIQNIGILGSFINTIMVASNSPHFKTIEI